MKACRYLHVPPPNVGAPPFVRTPRDYEYSCWVPLVPRPIGGISFPHSSVRVYNTKCLYVCMYCMYYRYDVYYYG